MPCSTGKPGPWGLASPCGVLSGHTAVLLPAIKDSVVRSPVPVAVECVPHCHYGMCLEPRLDVRVGQPPVSDEPTPPSMWV